MYTVAALYHFTPFDDPAALQGPLRAICEAGDICGTLLLAPEGINGTIAGPRAGLDAALAHIRALPGCADLAWKQSTAAARPFKKLKGKAGPFPPLAQITRTWVPIGARANSSSIFSL